MSDQVPSLLLMPAESVASLGTPPIRMVGAFWSASAADEEMLRAIVLPSSTVRVAGAERFSASALFVDGGDVDGGWWRLPRVSVSVSVAVTVRVMACVDSPVVRVRPES